MNRDDVAIAAFVLVLILVLTVAIEMAVKYSKEIADFEIYERATKK